ncbi:MAG: virulence-associated E family protein [Christensenellales bacterium]
MEHITAADLTDENIKTMDEQQLINSVIHSFDLDEFEKIRVQALMQIRARDLNISTAVSRMISSYNKKDKAAANKFNRELAMQDYSPSLRLDEKGTPTVTIDNFLQIMQTDPTYDGVRFNLLTNSPELHKDGKILRWSDSDDAESRHYIETNYNIHSENKHYDALRILFKDREYHPIQDIVDSLVWDGTPRIVSFLTKWLQAEDTDYTREVSRLIFAGGIHRLYSPGCKFDDVPVLIGTNQGEGKSTIVRWLAIHDSHYSEVTEIEGQRGIEQLEGAWICEVAELLALTRTKEQEAVKSYITRQRDKYRRPYDRQISEYPRRCIFIGTTNNEQFLKDKTGNRRFYPVRVNSTGYWLYERETECRNYILQCWAEAKAKYDDNTIPNYADQTLTNHFISAQEEAMEDDWRIGAIEQYLNRQPVGELVCVRQLKHEALSVNRDFPQDPTPKESQEIGVIMNRFKEWNKVGLKYTDYGRQRCWMKMNESNRADGMDEDLPF